MPYLTTAEDKKRYWSEYGRGSADVLTGAGRVFSGDVLGGGAQVYAGVKRIYEVIQWAKPTETATNENSPSAFAQGSAVRYFVPGEWDKFYARFHAEELWSRERALTTLRRAFREVGVNLPVESAAKIVAVILSDPMRKFGKAAANPLAASFLATVALWVGSPESSAAVEVPKNDDPKQTESRAFHDEKAFSYLEGLADLDPGALASSTALAVGVAAPLVPGGETVLTLLGDVGPVAPTPSPESGKVKVSRG